MWDTHIRTDYQAITKKPAGPAGAGINGKNLDYFDAVVFANATGEMALDEEQKKALLSFVQGRRQGLRRHPRRARRQLQVARVRAS